MRSSNGHISVQFISATTLFKLNSFKDILENSISDQQVILPHINNNTIEYQYRFDDFPKWIKDGITAVKRDNNNNNNNNNKRNIKTALMTDYQPTTLQSLYEIPSIETLFI
ncbi:hypothetical protein DFA_08330 [Cavenderia fasciculata]|uniref:Uncharacterized protein n=1 Tax=Cavenderia fasciculata TaxID=261658 RepID=F4Q5S6_CACFS|nr:uncharacterized protein DFA_08330 [Cavenderia fasciculata]EGG17335.1 hypothetical protein DFA_08330 [Cavenderia fasciculata]|eukprot:XP_004355819.1 hypothetical protein DFA_08330 [Cavenderia fasciculata]